MPASGVESTFSRSVSPPSLLFYGEGSTFGTFRALLPFAGEARYGAVGPLICKSLASRSEPFSAFGVCPGSSESSSYWTASFEPSAVPEWNIFLVGCVLSLLSWLAATESASESGLRSGTFTLS